MKNMKHKLLSAIVMISVLMCGSAKAENVDIQTVKQLGAYYFSVATGAKAPVNPDNLVLAKQIDNPTLCIPALYAFNVEGDGFVVMSASDCVEPVLAYSPVGNLNDVDKNPACLYMLNSYAKLISSQQNVEATASAEVRQLWDQLADKKLVCDPETKAVLVQSKWGQGDPDYPTFNVCCPVLNGKHVITGCVATAMAMIIKYWNYPIKGANSNPSGSSTAVWSWNNTNIRYNFAKDSNKFVYDSMPASLKYNSEWNYKHAIGKLMFACGVTSKMNWGLDASGTQSEYVKTALPQWFKYSDECRQVNRQSYSNSQWNNMLHDELETNKRPVYYSASDPGGSGRDAAGHAFVIAGVSSASENKYYVRWGWDGSSDGFYTLTPASAIEDAGGYRFTYGQAMIYKIHPKEEVGIDENTYFAPSPAYPNPATDYLMVPVDLPLNAYLTIYSIDGKQLDSHIVPANTKEYRLDLQSYAPGTYVYRLNGEAYKFTVR